MAFVTSTNVSLIFSSGAGANTLNGRGNLPALSSISATSGPEGVNTPTIRIDPTTTSALTAVIINYSFAQTQYNGGQTYVTDQNGIFTGNVITQVPFRIYYSDVAGYNTAAYTLSATGQTCSSGLQTGTIYLQLSSTALSSTNTGAVIPVGVLNTGFSVDGITAYPTASLNTNVFCINTPFPSDNPVYICVDEFARIQQFLG